MTSEEAIEILKEDVAELCSIECKGGYCDKCIQMAQKKAIEALEKQDKYAWHDLRKNPEDLPVYSEMVCVALKYADGDILTTAKLYNHNSKMFDGYHVVGYYETGLITEVIAWREIEPFSEVE